MHYIYNSVLEITLLVYYLKRQVNIANTNETFEFYVNSLTKHY